MKASRRLAKRILNHPLLGRIAAAATTHQIRAYERRLPLLWSIYSHIPETSTTHRGIGSGIQTNYYQYLSQHVATLPLQPRISVVVPVYRPRPEFLRQALQSVVVQTYSNWELCVIDDCSGDSIAKDVVESLQRRYPDRVFFKSLDENQGIAGASNEALAMATGGYCALLDHDDRMYPNALGEIVRHINLAFERDGRTPEMVYSDERVIGESGELRGEPYHKPDWSPTLHLSVNFTTHLSVYRTDLLRRLEGFRLGFDGSQDHDLALRASEMTDARIEHVPLVLYQWRAHEQSTAYSLNAKPAAAEAGVRAVREACERRGHAAEVSFDSSTGHYRVDFKIPDPQPLVSIVVPTRNHAALLRQCIESIRNVTTYGRYEIVVVDNGSDEQGVLAYLESLSEAQEIRVVRDDHYFNFARLCNRGALASRGDYLVLLNNDTEVLTPGWLEAMLGLAQQPTIGAVGARLLYANGRVQHAGVVGLADVIAGHSGRGRAADDSVYVHVINTPHEAIAVTGACLMIAKTKYDEVGGLDEQWVPNAYGDVDLCLRLRRQGYWNVYTPYATLTHIESPSRKANVETFEREHMRRRWGPELLTDPFLNPNLLRSESYSVDHRFARPELTALDFERILNPDQALPWASASTGFSHEDP